MEPQWNSASDRRQSPVTRTRFRAEHLLQQHAAARGRSVFAAGASNFPTAGAGLGTDRLHVVATHAAAHGNNA